MNRTRIIALIVLTALAGACGSGGRLDSARSRLGTSEGQPGATAPADAGAPAGATVPDTGTAPEPGPGSPAPTETRHPTTPPAPDSGSDRPAPTASGSGAPTHAGTGSADRAAPGPSPTGATAAPPPGPLPNSGNQAATGDRTGVTDTEVLFGMHQPLSGPVGFIVKNAWHGAQAYFNAVNEAGGVHNRKIRFVVSDDKYSAQGAAGAIRDLVDAKKVFAASCLAGVDQCVVGLEYANAKGTPYLHTGMRESTVAAAPWSFPTTASYPYSGTRLVDYLFTKRGYTPDRKMAALYVNSANFEEMVQRVERHLDDHHARFTVKEAIEKDQSDFSTAVTKMQNARVDTVWFETDPTLIAKFAAQAKLLRFTPQYVFTTPAGGDIYSQAAGGNLDGAFGLTTWADPEWAGSAPFTALYKKYYPDENTDEFAIVAYIAASVFVEGLRRAGPALDRGSFARGMQAIDRFDTKVSSPLAYAARPRAEAANSNLAVLEIHGTRSDQVTGFDF